MSYYWTPERRQKFTHYDNMSLHRAGDVPVLAVSVKDFRMWVRDRELEELFTFAGAWSHKLKRLYYYMNAFNVRYVQVGTGIIEYHDVPCEAAPEFFAGLYTFGAMMVLPHDALPMRIRGLTPELKRRRRTK